MAKDAGRVLDGGLDGANISRKIILTSTWDLPASG
jgi:hypothetical protein